MVVHVCPSLYQDLDHQNAWWCMSVQVFASCVKNCQLTIFWIVFLFSQKTVFDISCKLSPFRDNLHERSSPTFCRKSRRMTTICCLPSLLREHYRLNLKVLLLLLSDWCLTSSMLNLNISRRHSENNLKISLPPNHSLALTPSPHPAL